MAVAAARLRHPLSSRLRPVEVLLGERAERRGAGWRVPSRHLAPVAERFIAGLGIGQIASWGTLY